MHSRRDQDTVAADLPSAPALSELAWVTAFDVNRTIGGGMASMELLRRRFQRHRWLSTADHAVATAVSRLTPGTNILAYCAAVGWRFHGLPGAILALMSASVPGALVVLGLTAALLRVDEYRSVQALLAIGSMVASTLVASSAWYLIRPYLPQATWPVALFVGVSLALFLAGLTPVRVLLIVAVLGAIWPAAFGSGGRPPDAR